MRTKILKWGNSLGLRIPRSFAEDIRIHEGSTVDLRMEDGQLVVRPLPAPGRSLAELVGRITPENLHGEIETGGPLGGEEW